MRRRPSPIVAGAVSELAGAGGAPSRLSQKAVAMRQGEGLGAQGVGGEAMRDLREDVEDDAESFIRILSWTDVVSYAAAITVLILLFRWWLW
jgi:hypothetical protein